MSYFVDQNDFKIIPSSPVAYWCPHGLLKAFRSSTTIDHIAPPRIGMMTSDNERFLRGWQELGIPKIGFDFCDTEQAISSDAKWFPYKKGGVFRKWYGNNELVVNWQHGGEEIIAAGMTSFRGKDFYFREGLSWSFVSSLAFSCRFTPPGFIFDIQGSSCFPAEIDRGLVTSLLNSVVGEYILKLLNPTLSYQSGDIRRIPIVTTLNEHRSYLNDVCSILIEYGQVDWDSFERSWGFKNNPLIVGWVSDSVTQQTEAIDAGLRDETANPTYKLSNIYADWQTQNRQTIAEMQRLEQENNRLFIDAYGLQDEDEIKPDVPLEQITLTVNPKYRYGGNLADEELAQRFQSDTLAELISYAIGCMMGRYRLDKPGLIFAHEGNVDFDNIYNGNTNSSFLITNPFVADDDGIIPLTDQEWFKDDATNRFRDFVRTVWGEENLPLNLDFVAESLCLSALKPKKSESSLETIRRYLSPIL